MLGLTFGGLGFPRTATEMLKISPLSTHSEKDGIDLMLDLMLVDRSASETAVLEMLFGHNLKGSESLLIQGSRIKLEWSVAAGHEVMYMLISEGHGPSPVPLKGGTLGLDNTVLSPHEQSPLQPISIPIGRVDKDEVIAKVLASFPHLSFTIRPKILLLVYC